MDHEDLIRVREIIAGESGAQVVSLTRLGWTIHGRCDVAKVDKDFTLILSRKWQEPDIRVLLKDFWKAESFSVSPTQAKLNSAEDRRAQGIVLKTAQHNDKCWEAGLLWRIDNKTLPKSRINAKRSLVSVKRK